jgi:ArsR family transcriptional regulator
MVEFGTRKARENGIDNLEFRLGDLESPPLEQASVDLVVLSQALHHAAQPQAALRASAAILKPGGTILILDLARHRFEQARALYGDRWLGFSDSELYQWLELAGFHDLEVSTVAREEQPPHFETLLATGSR